ncbi:MAG: hypothetical protein AAB443_03220 [Patescibacteria group bacterium]
MKRDLIKTLVGLPVLVIFLALSSGGFDQVMTLAFFSIVCTAGMGAFVWFGLSLLIGHIMLALVIPNLIPSTRAYIEKEILISVSTKLKNKEEGVLLDYIAKARASGMNDELISTSLISKGWKSELVSSVLSSAPKP